MFLATKRPRCRFCWSLWPQCRSNLSFLAIFLVLTTSCDGSSYKSAEIKEWVAEDSTCDGDDSAMLQAARPQQHLTDGSVPHKTGSLAHMHLLLPHLNGHQDLFKKGQEQASAANGLVQNPSEQSLPDSADASQLTRTMLGAASASETSAKFSTLPASTDGLPSQSHVTSSSRVASDNMTKAAASLDGNARTSMKSEQPVISPAENNSHQKVQASLTAKVQLPEVDQKANLSFFDLKAAGTGKNPEERGLEVLMQMSSAAKVAVGYMTRPGDTFPSILPFIAVVIGFVTCSAAVYFAVVSTMQEGSICENAERPSIARQAGIGSGHSLMGRPRNSFRDPYEAYGSSASLAPMAAGRTSLLSVSRLTEHSLLPTQASRPVEHRLSTTSAAQHLLVPSLALKSNGARPSTTLAQVPPANGGLPTLSAVPLPPVAGMGPPPPLCPALVLPAREAHLEVPLPEISSVLEQRSGNFFVLGPLGNKMLQVNFQNNAFDVHMVQPSSALVASVSLSAGGQDSRCRLDVYGADGALYGHIEQRAGGFCMAVRSLSGQEVQDALHIRGDAQALRLTATSAEDGQPAIS
ncbi:unnamed protein product [Polarella glacialis]|uniref:Altered inheritance of mitochondria protein 24, mitochondrial n=1 Tax=Polarella glacialis TaxID=89957 RepID=A0A813I6D8_POLGL|nr:unnamed protein product [Polarella glacialis]CAE8645384.1 unnamed protein product [Polarella glacialis]